MLRLTVCLAALFLWRLDLLSSPVSSPSGGVWSCCTVARCVPPGDSSATSIGVGAEGRRGARHAAAFEELLPVLPLPASLLQSYGGESHQNATARHRCRQHQQQQKNHQLLQAAGHPPGGWSRTRWAASLSSLLSLRLFIPEIHRLWSLGSHAQLDRGVGALPILRCQVHLRWSGRMAPPPAPTSL